MLHAFCNKNKANSRRIKIKKWEKMNKNPEETSNYIKSDYE
jgi:hypothetical protein